jgi:hypothetical protein
MKEQGREESEFDRGKNFAPRRRIRLMTPKVPIRLSLITSRIFSLFPGGQTVHGICQSIEVEASR